MKLTMHMFMVLMRYAGCAYVMVLGMFGIVDAYNGYTYPVYSWRAMIGIELAAMVVGLFLSLACMLRHAGKPEFIAASTPDDEAKKELMGKPPTKAERDAMHKQKNVNYLASVSHRSVDFAFFALMTVTSLWLMMQVVFLYAYTQSSDGYQAALDAGFPTDTPIYYAVFFKFQLMYSLQLQMALAIGVCLVGYAMSKASKHLA